jgi:hypothetical protein
MEVADALNAEYGEAAGGGIRGGKQAPLFESGNDYLARNFPRLDFIRSARIMDNSPTADSRLTADGQTGQSHSPGP